MTFWARSFPSQKQTDQPADDETVPVHARTMASPQSPATLLTPQQSPSHRQAACASPLSKSAGRAARTAMTPKHVSRASKNAAFSKNAKSPHAKTPRTALEKQLEQVEKQLQTMENGSTQSPGASLAGPEPYDAAVDIDV